MEKRKQKQFVQAQNLETNVIANNRLIHVFGCGRSYIPTLDTFYRAGGFVNISAMLDIDLMLDNGAATSIPYRKEIE